MYQRTGAMDALAAARAKALLMGDSSGCWRQARRDLAAATGWAVRRPGGGQRCAGQVAATHGEFPEPAPDRTRWTRPPVAAACPAGHSNLPREMLPVLDGIGPPDMRVAGRLSMPSA
jgi:hypothetical protein